MHGAQNSRFADKEKNLSLNRGFHSELCVIELKDTHSSSELPKDAVKQAIAYAAFIIKLVRCDEAQGQNWYKYFGINSDITDKPVTVNAVIAMPYPDDDPKKFVDIDTSFTREEVKVGDDIIKLHYIFFTKAALKKSNEEEGFKTSLPVKLSESPCKEQQ